MPNCDNSPTVPLFGGIPDGNAKSFVVPDRMKIMAPTMRRTHWNCGPLVDHLVKMFDPPLVT
jgi:hypothetical protein